MLFEVEQKFCWNAEKLCRLQRNLGRPPFKSIVKFKNAKFQDTYFDSQHKLSDNGLWVRKRRYSGSVSLGIPHGTAEWEAKQMRHGGSQLRSTFEETKDTVRIAHLVGAHVPGRLRPVNNFGLEKLCQFETHRQTFKADSKVRCFGNLFSIRYHRFDTDFDILNSSQSYSTARTLDIESARSS